MHDEKEVVEADTVKSRVEQAMPLAQRRKEKSKGKDYNHCDTIGRAL